MAKLFGRSYTRDQLLRRVGDVSQLGGTRLVELLDGNQRGVRAVDFATGTGFAFTVLLDRGMDIYNAAHCGRSLAWHATPGAVHPAFHEPEGLGFLRTFEGGLLCTCGLTYAGAPCTDEGEPLGLHGRISHVPARHVCLDAAWDGDEYDFWVKGSVRETRVFGPNLVLTRTVRARLGESRLFLEDRIVNEGFEPQPLMVLYHINGGFPVVDKGAELIAPSRAAAPATDYAAKIGARWASFDAPTPGVPEACYRHRLAAERDGTTFVALVNPTLDGGFGYYVQFNRKQLPHFTEWKMMGEGMYVVGTEPCVMPLYPRSELRKKGKLPFIQPGEERLIQLELGVVAGPAALRALRRRCRALTKA
ncbi:MAG TPA: aldose 1-epimerase family protein [Planctomycetota bacterium]|nr:aldose 1-epimerase family protein [Planctomycetota bacterium]HRR79961.1 aldose 1-epimerase family protein [Planctomycetota bacterium]HRT95753.1 aldose 1-epimerase family protein [Planctomycetota bacterium]